LTPNLDIAWLRQAGLLAMRLSALLMVTPFLGTGVVPTRIRILVVLALAGTISAWLPIDHGGAAGALAAGGAGQLFAAAALELAVGATLALGILLAFSSASMAGQLIGVEMGLGLGQVFDPSADTGTPLMASALHQVAVLVFFLLDGHHALLRGVVLSLERFPLGQPWPIGLALGPILKQVAASFTLGFALAAPVVVTLFMIEVALGVLSRNLPQANMLVVGIPIKVVAGLLLMATWAPSLQDVLARIYFGIFSGWTELFSGAA
jgi:flagellar biosynthetic protein FliR